MYKVLAIVSTCTCISHHVYIKIIFYKMGGNITYDCIDTMFIILIKHLHLSAIFQPFCTVRMKSMIFDLVSKTTFLQNNVNRMLTFN